MRRFFLQPNQNYKILLLLEDIIIILLSLTLIFIIGNYYEHPSINLEGEKFIYIYITIIGFILLISYTLGLYDFQNISRKKSLLFSVLMTYVCVFLIYSVLAYFIISLRPGKFVLLLFTIVSCCLTFIFRLIFVKFIIIPPKRVLFIGNNKIIRDLYNIITTQYQQFYQIVDHWHRHSHNPTFPDLYNFVKEKKIDTIVYSSKANILEKLTRGLIKIRFSQKNIYDSHNFYQFLTGKFPIHYLDDVSLLLYSQREIFFPGTMAKLKRGVDICFVLLYLPVALILILIAAIAIKIESKGPIFFSQERLGLNEKPFKLIKLRTMIDNAEQFGPKWCNVNDCRVTRVGRILRKLRIDELPQLINIIKGEMSVVGPRPIRQHFTDLLAKEIPFYRLRLLVKPGLTGWAQVQNGHANSIGLHSLMAQYDLFYIVNQSFFLDIYIILKTFKVIVFGKGR